jgi:acetyltransferase-like isoleucine patch superfamily enzyme
VLTRIFVRGLDRLEILTATLYFRLRYWPLVSMADTALICGRVLVKAHWRDGRTIRVKLGQNARVQAGTVFQGSGVIDIGENSTINNYVILVSNLGISIGANVMLAHGVCVIDTDHVTDVLDSPMNVQGIRSRPVKICDNVWIGRNATILKGVTVGEGAVVGAGAVVTKDVPPYAVVVGVPARVWKLRRTDQ